jgi:hypothetical protein
MLSMAHWAIVIISASTVVFSLCTSVRLHIRAAEKFKT